MRKRNIRLIALILVIALALSLVAGLAMGASAATVNYVTGTPSKVSGYYNIIKNWGTRGTTATFLSPNALKFYSKNDITYEELSKLSGASGTSDVPGSALYAALHQLVESNQTKETSYGDTRYLFPFTDCQGNGVTSSAISSFYSGKSVGPAWDGGSTWNREHTWPNSKGNANGNGENDIMMLRPTAKSENGSRSNTAYGESAGYYFPNKESGGAYDVRGDVARIMLYVYTRWGTANMWGSYGVIESKEVLLKWMAADPVDTWEMGRNDSTESITGTRNVYVDYPELAFLLFNEEVPENMVSPSNGDGTIPPTPTVPPAPTDPKEILEAAYALGAGETLPYTATLTGKITAVNTAYSTQYKNVTVTMVVAGCETMPIKCFRLKGDGADKIAVGDTITVTGSIINYQHSSGNTEVEFNAGCVMNSWVAGGESTDPTDPPAPVDPNYVTAPVAGVAYKFGMIQENVSTSQVYYLKGGMSGYYMSTSTSEADAIDVYLESTAGGYHLYTNAGDNKQYINMVVSGTHVNGVYATSASTVYTFDTDTATLVATVNGEQYRFGTRDDKTYTTVGPVVVTKGNFYCKLYATEAASVPGDLDGNTSVNNDDVILLLWHTMFPQEYPLGVNGDINHDGSVNNEDVVLLLWHTMFPQDYPL